MLARSLGSAIHSLILLISKRRRLVGGRPAHHPSIPFFVMPLQLTIKANRRSERASESASVAANEEASSKWSASECGAMGDATQHHPHPISTTTTEHEAERASERARCQRWMGRMCVICRHRSHSAAATSIGNRQTFSASFSHAPEGGRRSSCLPVMRLRGEGGGGGGDGLLSPAAAHANRQFCWQ